MDVDINGLFTIALGVFLALAARDALGVVFGRLLGTGRITGSNGGSANTVSEERL